MRRSSYIAPHYYEKSDDYSMLIFLENTQINRIRTIEMKIMPTYAKISAIISIYSGSIIAKYAEIPISKHASMIRISIY